MGFLVVAVLVGRFLAPRLFDVIVRMRVRYVLLVVASIAFALGLAALAGLAGSALIIGAFAAGLILSGTNQFDTIEHEVRPVASIFTPIFFVSVGVVGQPRPPEPFHPGGARRRSWWRARSSSSRSSARSRPAGPRPGPGSGGSSSASAWCRGERSGLIFADIGRRSGVSGRRGVRRRAPGGDGDYLHRAARAQGALRAGLAGVRP